jgi:hypothetical protein
MSFWYYLFLIDLLEVDCSLEIKQFAHLEFEQYIYLELIHSSGI